MPSCWLATCHLELSSGEAPRSHFSTDIFHHRPAIMENSSLLITPYGRLRQDRGIDLTRTGMPI